MIEIPIKPLSINQAWRGRRFKTKEYTQYEHDLFYLLPKLKVPHGKLQLKLQFGFSSRMSDIDNGIKSFIDVLQKKYLFNDKFIYKIHVEKFDVEKGEEFIAFDIQTYLQG